MPDPRPPTLVADIGGTNTRVALADGTALRAGTVRRYRNADFAGLEPVLAGYLAEQGDPACAGACVAAAGPVRDGVATLTNLGWTIDGATLARAARTGRVAILNDLQAQGHALGHLAPEGLRTIVPGPAAPAGAARLVIGIGTGFNAAPVHATPGGRVVPPSECGHTTLPVRTDEDLALARSVGRAHGFAGVEEVLSGRGLEHLHAFVTGRAGSAAARTAAEIMALIDAGDPAAQETGRAFARFAGAVAGDLALVHLPFGGIYLCGGVARAFAVHLGPLGFAATFRDKGRFSSFMDGFGVQVVTDDYAALTGCAAHLAGTG